MAKELFRNAWILCLGTSALLATGCKQEPVAIAPSTAAPSTVAPSTQDSVAKTSEPTNKPSNTGQVPGALKDLASAKVQDTPKTQESARLSDPSMPIAAPGTTPAASSANESRANPLFTLAPSKGPAPYRFRQLTLFRSGPSGDLEMQLTGDGIYRIRDHANGRSYAGDGKLTDEQIADWAEGMKDWETLKDAYLPDPNAKDVDIVEIIYGGKKVAAIAGSAQTPKAFADAYKRLLDLQEQSRKENAEPAKPDPSAPVPQTPKPAEPAKEPESK